MIVPFLRILVLILLIFSIMVDVDIPVILHTQVNQLIIAIIIIFIIIIIDEILGFLLGLLFLVLYFKYYQKLIKNNSSNNNYLKEPLLEKKPNETNINSNQNSKTERFDEIKPPSNERIEAVQDHYIKYSNDCVEMPYVSNELLEKAQNNIFDVNNYYNEIRSDNNTYGVQGLNSDSIHYPAFDTTDHHFHDYNKL